MKVLQWYLYNIFNTFEQFIAINFINTYEVRFQCPNTQILSSNLTCYAAPWKI